MKHVWYFFFALDDQMLIKANILVDYEVFCLEFIVFYVFVMLCTENV